MADSDERSVLTAVQLMWINLFQDTLAALALATDPPPPHILNRNPEPKSAPLITISMWKMIIGQSIYQLTVTLILDFRGAQILSYTTAQEQGQLQTAIFNTYVFMQIFNMYKYVSPCFIYWVGDRLLVANTTTPTVTVSSVTSTSSRASFVIGYSLPSA